MCSQHALLGATNQGISLFEVICGYEYPATEKLLTLLIGSTLDQLKQISLCATLYYNSFSLKFHRPCVFATLTSGSCWTNIIYLRNPVDYLMPCHLLLHIRYYILYYITLYYIILYYNFNILCDNIIISCYNHSIL